VGRAWEKRSTARRVTVPAESAGKSSARVADTSMFVNASERITSRRNATFLLLDSMRETLVPEDQILMGSPGNPAPDPMSMSRGRCAPDPGAVRVDHPCPGLSGAFEVSAWLGSWVAMSDLLAAGDGGAP